MCGCGGGEDSRWEEKGVVDLEVGFSLCSVRASMGCNGGGTDGEHYSVYYCSMACTAWQSVTLPTQVVFYFNHRLTTRPATHAHATHHTAESHK